MTTEHLEILKDPQTNNKFIKISVNDSISYIVAKRTISSYKESLYYILAIFIRASDYQSKSNEVNSIMFYTFFYMFLAEAFLVLITLLVVIFIASIYTKRVVKPIVQLTDYAKAINKNAHDRSAKKNFKKLVAIDLSQIKV